MSEAKKQEKKKHRATRTILSLSLSYVFFFNRSNYDDPGLLEEHMTLLLITKYCLQCECNTSILTQWKSKRNQTNWPASRSALLTEANCSYVCSCLWSCSSINVWESNPGILFSGKAGLQRWQISLTRCLQMRLERPAWVTRNRLAQRKGYRFVPPDELASPKCYFSFATHGCTQPKP